VGGRVIGGLVLVAGGVTRAYAHEDMHRLMLLSEEVLVCGCRDRAKRVCLLYRPSTDFYNCTFWDMIILVPLSDQVCWRTQSGKLYYNT
jgi:hypothetical protein